MLTQEAIKEFKDLYLKLYEVELTNEEASLRANNLLSLYEVIYKELKNEHENKYRRNDSKN